jgi:hypothetical protein
LIKLFPNEYDSDYCKKGDFRGTLLEGYSEDLSDLDKLNIINSVKVHIKPFKKWKIVSPSGEIYIVDNIKTFSVQHNLNHTIMGNISRKSGTYLHKGWSCERYN